MIQAVYDADCDECWEYFEDETGHSITFTDKSTMKRELEFSGWQVRGDHCWCPKHKDKDKEN